MYNRLQCQASVIRVKQVRKTVACPRCHGDRRVYPLVVFIPGFTRCIPLSTSLYISQPVGERFNLISRDQGPETLSKHMNDSIIAFSKGNFPFLRSNLNLDSGLNLSLYSIKRRIKPINGGCNTEYSSLSRCWPQVYSVQRV